MIDLCFLGTGGTLPMPDRALASLYVRVNGHALLIDCGEGTQVGIRRLGWGFKCIDGILITHYHGDHVGGLPGLLLSIDKAGREEPLHIWGPAGLKRIVDGLRVVAPQVQYPIILHDGDNSAFSLIGLKIRSFPLNHGVPCWGWRLQLPRRPLFDPLKAKRLGIPVQDWKKLQDGQSVTLNGQTVQPEQISGNPRKGISLLYATDTRPVPAILHEGKGVDLMILEGTYGEEEKLPQALKNRHMLFREAAALARDAGAQRLMLTHFSTGLEVPEDSLPNATEIFPETACATDGLTLTLRYPD